MAISFSGGRSRSIRREPPTMGKQLVNFITCDWEWSAPFLQFTKPGENRRRIGDRLVWVVMQSNCLTHWATRALPEQRKVVFTTLSELRVLSFVITSLLLTRYVSYKKQELLNLRVHLSGSVLLIYLVFYILLLCVFLFGVLYCNVRYCFVYKRCLVRLCLQLFVGWWVFECGGVRHLLICLACVCLGVVVSDTCCVVFFVVFCALCCRFLWIVLFWLPFRYSLTLDSRK